MILVGGVGRLVGRECWTGEERRDETRDDERGEGWCELGLMEWRGGDLQNVNVVWDSCVNGCDGGDLVSCWEKDSWGDEPSAFCVKYWNAPLPYAGVACIDHECS